MPLNPCNIDWSATAAWVQAIGSISKAGVPFAGLEMPHRKPRAIRFLAEKPGPSPLDRRTDDRRVGKAGVDKDPVDIQDDQVAVWYAIVPGAAQ